MCEDRVRPAREHDDIRQQRAQGYSAGSLHSPGVLVLTLKYVGYAGKALSNLLGQIAVRANETCKAATSQAADAVGALRHPTTLEGLGAAAVWASPPEDVQNVLVRAS